MKVGFATNDWAKTDLDADGYPQSGGSGHYRCRLPAKYLAADHDIETVVGVLIVHNKEDLVGVQTWDATPHWDCDVIVSQRHMVAGLDDIFRRARANGQRIVNDVDDHFDALDKRNHAYRQVEGNPLSNTGEYRRNILAGDMVTVSTPVLREHYRNLGHDNVVLLENGVELSAFASGRPQNDVPTIGWAGCIPWRSGDVETLRKWLPDFCRRHPDVRIRHDGHVPGWPLFATAAGLKPDQVVTGPMRPVSEIPRLYDDMDVGLVPLNDVPFNHAKSWIKGLEYVAARVPFVAQSLPEYERLRAQYGIGRTAGGRGAWLRQMEAMLDPARREDATDVNLVALEDSGLIWPDRANVWAEAYRSLT